ncbi:heavy metal translocating P-type ATPase [uncultured Bifidobacterium sp.]|uniref:heavy metal translocating P-type ATPase n=1 Tax=uncultured Bifidobacterium sp. TaxID=165187 RepID=UPI0025901C57|nr:heavy metal translocating P-type ATPase [uncultured Bifidobacterium sp.]MEE0654054.1 heavy metal translocating P-type ATPase [Bifidobacterium criceti]
MRKIIDLCKEVPLLPLSLLAAIPLALIPDWRPWGHIHAAFDPGVGQWIVILFVAWTIYTSIREMIDSIRHGHVGVDLLAIVALVSTVCVQQYWASWAVVLMVASGEAIESYAQNKAKGNLTALIKAAPQQAHVVTLPGTDAGVADGADTSGEGFRKVQQAVEDAQRSGKAITAGNGHFETVPVNDVKLGSVLLILPGEIVPVDGMLLSGTATVDLSNINGEPVPRTIFAGAKVLSGSINGSATMMIRTTSLATDSQYQQILKLVSSAEESRAAVVRTADMLAVPFTIISFAIAIVAWIVSGTGLRFAQVLVLATPCPLLIAAPVAYVAGTARLAKRKILVKSQDVLENLGRVTHVFFDKTGTLTVKQPQVVRVEKAAGIPADVSEDEILMLAGIVEGFSVHVLAKGIVEAGRKAMERLGRLPSSSGKTAADVDATQRTLPNPNENYPVVGNVSEIPGKGVRGTVDGHKVEVGRYAFVTEQDIASHEVHDAAEEAKNEKAMEAADEAAAHLWPDMLEPDEMATYIAIDGHLAARIVLRDIPRYNAKQSIEELRALGVKEETMLTGDKQSSAMIIANEVGITDVRYELLPQDKVNAVRDAAEQEKSGTESWWNRAAAKLLGEPIHRDVTMMVGDGVNDSPVLAVADIGMAMTDGTSTAASESAEVVIMNDDIGAVPTGVRIARQTKQRMLQAVLIGIALAIVGMVCAAFNLIPVVAGAFLQECIDVVSILWALTALFDRK